MSSASTFPGPVPRRRSPVRVASAGLLAGLLAGGAAAAPPSEAPKAQEAPPKEVTFKADVMRSKPTADGGDILYLSEGVSITHVDRKDPSKKTVLTAEEMEITRDSDGAVTVAVATGNPKVTDEQSHVVGDKITLRPGRRRALIEGKVKIVTKRKKKAPQNAPEPTRVASAGAALPAQPPRPTSFRDRVEGDVVITADRVEYNYRTKDADATGSVVVVNKGWKLKMPKAVYVDKTEMLTLTGPISGVDEKGQTVEHEGDMEVSLKEDAEFFASKGKGRVTGRLLIKEDEDEESTKREEGQPDAKPAEEQRR